MAHPEPTGRLSRRTLLSLAAAGTAVTAAGLPLATPAAARPGLAAKPGPIVPVYVEVNNHSILNAGKYTLASSGAQVFDLAIIFAANINYDGSKAYLHFNENVQRTLDNVATLVRPLQQKGIKVLLSILGNHQGAGFANFPSRQAADAFAQQLADAVNRYGLDGIDFDDEYADYGVNGTPQPNASSFVYLVQALRAKLPTKLITLYDIGPSAARLSYEDQSVAETFDYAWNPYYGTYSIPRGPSAKAKLGPAAVWINNSSNAASLATRTKNEGYGVYLAYDLPGGDASNYVSGFTNVLYGSRTVYTP